MPIRIDLLKKASLRQKPPHIAKSFTEAVSKSQATAFLCHSHEDAELAKGLQILLAENECDVYIDWQDSTMPLVPDQETANRIKEKISDCDWFLFLTTPNSTASRWCPWEIGYADGKKPNGNILLIRTSNNIGISYGNEYLGLYSEVTLTDKEQLAVFPVGKKNGGALLKNLM